MDFFLDDQPSNDFSASTLEEFQSKCKISFYSKTTSSLPADDCFICSQPLKDVATVIRSCKCSANPCMSHECKCSGNPCCSDCLVQCLWSQTPSHLKSSGRYRAHCPFCKADFCHLDVIVSRLPSKKVEPPSKTNAMSQKPSSRRKSSKKSPIKT
eukprot:TRINITY_DN22459_c0_g1_i1.p1 TRINITY_DN22459_c0_g1~~TRINITY_DN22459_c0_g1_i1.p1  ORF type:complete len:155 (+),score=7.86 TRINITY_DN22459_c0_g1_i1:102-566(+)